MHDQTIIQVEKWSLIVDAVQSLSFVDMPGQARSKQWQRTTEILRAIGSLELLDWALQQAEIARNIEQGIRDLRPRKSGATHRLTLDYVRARHAKSRTVLAWVEAAVADDADQTRGPSRVFTSELRPPPRYGNPLARDDDEAKG